MSTPESQNPQSKGMLWTGRALSGLVVVFLLMDATMKLLNLAVVRETGVQLGWQENSAITLGVLLLIATLLYVFPKTALLGAILLTGYLGGAIATHLRIGNPLFTHTLFGVYIGLMVWGGLWLRDASLRKLFPLRHE